MRKTVPVLSTILLSLSLLLAGGCGGGGGGGAEPVAGSGPGPGPAPAGIVSVTPVNNATDIPLDAPIRVAFSKDMDPATITLSTISIRSGGVPVTGSLKYGTLYEVTVTTGVRDASGNPLGSPYTWRFTTEAPPPSVLAGVLSFDANAAVSYDAATRTATLDVNALYSLEGIGVRAVQPSSDNGATAIAEEITTASACGEFGFPGLPPGKWLIVAEKEFPGGPVRRILGVSSTNVIGTPLLHYISMQDVTPDPAIVRLDIFCLDCHPSIDNVTRSGQIYRDAHKSGIRPPTWYENSVRYDSYGWMTCGSCHSVHDPTGFQNFLLGTGGSFCNQCH
ncbi:MAG TPA: Ig-like domain-containing protein [Candidatus Deferrimicrobiaceae bacterium]